MKNTFLATLLALIIFPYITTPASAQTFQFNVRQQQGQGVSIGSASSAEGIVQIIIVNVITLFFAVGGIGVVIYFIWGALDWILSGGDKEKVANARKKMTHAIIGLVLLALSFVIINIVGAIIGFNPLGNLQLRGLGDGGSPVVPNQ